MKGNCNNCQFCSLFHILLGHSVDDKRRSSAQRWQPGRILSRAERRRTALVHSCMFCMFCPIILIDRKREGSFLKESVSLMTCYYMTVCIVYKTYSIKRIKRTSDNRAKGNILFFSQFPQDLVFREQSDICCQAVDVIEELFRCDPTVCCSISGLLKHSIPRFLRLTDAGVSENENYSNRRLSFYNTVVAQEFRNALFYVLWILFYSILFLFHFQNAFQDHCDCCVVQPIVEKINFRTGLILPLWRHLCLFFRAQLPLNQIR